MPADVYSTVHACEGCAKNPIKERHHSNYLKLFPAAKPLEFLCMDILGPLPKTKPGNRYLLVMTDRFSKLMRTTLFRTFSMTSVARAFCNHLVFAYVPPALVLTDRGQQFAS